MTALTRLARHRAGVAAAVVLSLALGAVIAFALSSNGYPARHVDLNDGGIWVTDNSLDLFGRFDKPIAQLDTGFGPPGGAQVSASLDIVQDGATVLARDDAAGRVYPVDVSLGTLVSGDAVDIPAGFALQTGGGTIASLDPKTGRIWAVRVPADGTRPSLATMDPTLKPLATVGPTAALAVSADGTVFAVAGSTLLRMDATPTGFGKPVATTLASTVTAPQLTAVGEHPVVLDSATARVLVPSGPAVTLTGPGAGAVLQAPGPDADAVYVATPAGLQRIRLAGGPSVDVYRDDTASTSRTAAQPTVLGSCVHAAWGGTPGVYARSCLDGPAQVTPLPKGSHPSRPVFRVNRDQIVLNDLDSGGIWLVDGTPQKVDNWLSIKPPPTKEQDKNPRKNPNTQAISSQDRKPQAVSDIEGARPGRANVMHVMDNDSDPDGDILSIVSISATSVNGAALAIAPDGQTIVATLPDGDTAPFSFSYTIDDGRGRSASASVSVQIRADGQNTAPALRKGFVAKAGTVAAGATYAAPVLSDWRDADNDPLVLTAATSPDATVSTTADGRVLVDAPDTAAKLTVGYTVADGFGGESKGSFVVKVLDPDATDAIAPVAEPDVVRASVGTALVIHPLANDIPGSDPTDPDATIQLSGQVPAPAGMSLTEDVSAGTITVVPRQGKTFLLTYGASFGTSTVAKGQIRVDVSPRSTPSPILAMPDVAVLRGQQATIVDVLANDFDPAGAVMVVQQAGQLASDPDQSLEVAIIQGRWLRISSNRAAVGSTYNVRYVVQDGVSAQAVGEVSVTQLPVPPTDSAPVTQDDTAVVRAGDSVTVPVLDNDSDPDGDPLQLVQDGTRVTTGGGSAHVFVNGVRYAAPESVATPQQAVVDYVVSDPSGAKTTGHIRITVNPASDAAHDQPPQPVSVQAGVVSGDTQTISIPTTGVDPDGDSVTVIGITSPPTLGRVLGFGANSIRYQAYPSSTGPDTLTYVVQDRYGLTNTATVRIGVVPPGAPQPPVAVDDPVTAAPGATVKVDVLANDFQSPGDVVSIEALSRTNGTVPAGTTLADDQVTVTAPPLSAKPLIVSYGLTDGTAQPSIGQIVLRTKAGYNNPPIARDDDAKLPASGATTTVDVLANDVDPDGPNSRLTVVSTGDPTVRISGANLVIPLSAFPRTVPYTVRDLRGAIAIGVVHVPGTGNGAPHLKPGVTTVRLAKGQTRTIDIGDYVTDPAGKALRLTTSNRIWASPGTGLSTTSQGTKSLVLHALGDYVGPAAMTFQVTDGATPGAAGAQTAVVTVPVQIGPVTPVIRCPATTLDLVEGGDPLSLDVVTLCHVWTDSSSDLDAVTFTGSWARQLTGVSVSTSGASDRIVQLVAHGAARPGSTGVLTVSAQGTSARSTLNIRVVGAPPANVRPITVEGVKAGQTAAIDVRGYVSSPLADATLLVRSIHQTSGMPATATAGGSALTITPGADTHGPMTFSYVVTDAPSLPARNIIGTVTLQVLGRPATPSRPSITAVRSETAVVAFVPPPPNGAPITQFQLRDNYGSVYTCQASPCTVTGLHNGRSYTFTVRAQNIVGWSDTSPPSAPRIPDQVPQAPLGLAAKPGDRKAALSWNAAAVNGSRVDYYQVKTSPGTGGVKQVAALSTTVSGLTNGTSYTAQVRAHNRQGFSPWSTAVPFIPFGTPVTMAAPVAATGDPSVAASERTINVSWTAADGNGRDITSYALTEYRDGAAATTVTLGGSVTSTTFTVPTSSSTYTYSITATNSGALTSSPSPRSNSIDASTAPGQMGTPSAAATGNSGAVTLSGIAAPQANGAPITQLQYSANGGGWQQLPSFASSQTVGGLSDGTAYTFQVRGCNKNGCGAPSGSSNSATPYSPPAAPAAAASSNGSQTNPAITFSWSGGGGNGRPIADYQIRIDGGGWTNKGASGGSETNSYGNSQTHTIDVRVVNTAGQTSPVSSASAKTAAPVPPDPETITLSKGASAVGQNNCSSVYCHYLVITPHQFSGTFAYNCYQDGTVFASGTGSFSDGNGTRLVCYNGNPYEVHVTMHGLTSNSVYPKPQWG